GFRSLVWVGETDKSESLGLASFRIRHDFGRGDCTVVAESFAETLIIYFVGNILDEEIDALVFVEFLCFGLSVHLAEFLGTLMFLLCSSNIQKFTVELSIIELISSFHSSL